jgi:hypothetical protein
MGCTNDGVSPPPGYVLVNSSEGGIYDSRQAHTATRTARFAASGP